MSARLQRLLSPRSIAVVGGGAWCENVVEQCQKMGFAGSIWPVHPRRTDIGGLEVFSSISALPDAPDAAFIGINREASVVATRELAERGAGGAVCFASGFAERPGPDGADLQGALVMAAGRMPILGPNCYGLINCLDGALLWPDQHGAKRVERGVALVTQSSNVAINLTMQRRGLPVAYVVTAGNQAQTGLSEIGRGLLADDRVTALGLHIEGIDDLAAFHELAAAARRSGKPVVVLKVGKSEASQAAAVTHTASLAGSDAGADALFRHLGMARTATLDGFLEALKLAHLAGPLDSFRIASMSCSGGEASLVADLAHGTRLQFPVLSKAQEDALSAALGARVDLANPLDYHTYIWPDTDRMAATFAAMMLGDLALGLVVLDVPREDRCDTSDWANVVEAMAIAQEMSGRRLAILASLPENLPEHWCESVAARGIVPLCGLSAGLEAVVALAGIGEAWRKDRPPCPILPRDFGETRTLAEADAKARLAAGGIAIPKSARFTSLAGIDEALRGLQSPLVLKGEGFAHKTEAGAVVTDLTCASSVKAAAKEMAAPSYLVEEQVTGIVAELILGITCDPAHGFLLTIGAGGQLTEIWQDTAQILLPATRDDIRAAVEALKIGPVLTGFRSRPAADIDAILDAAEALQALFIEAGGKIAEVEVNPLLALEDRAVAVDALIREEIE